MSVPPTLLTGPAKDELVAFYTEVFGWTHLTMMDDDGKRVVFQTYSLEQFVYLHGDDQPMSCPRLDHYGFSVGTEAELDDFLARCRAYKERDDRVDIIDKHTEDHGPLAISAFYVGYLLPMMIEIQWWDMKDGAKANA